MLSGAPSTVWALATASDPLEPSLAAGRLVLPRATRRVPLLAAAAVAHAALSLGWTVALAALPRGARWGAAGGAVIATLDLGLARRIGGERFAPVAALPVLPQLADHLAFGLVADRALRG